MSTQAPSFYGGVTLTDFKQCFQLMECNDPSLFQQWILQWQDLAEFEIFPIVPSKETTEIVTKFL